MRIRQRAGVLLSSILILLYSTSKAQNTDSVIFKGVLLSYQKKAVKEKFKRFVPFSIDSKKLQQFVKEKETSSFRLQVNDTLGWNILLQPANIVSPDYSLKVITPDGTQTIASHPDFLFKGKTKNGGDVRLAIRENFIYGCISEDEKEYFIQPLKNFDSSASKDEFIMYKTEDKENDNDFSCGVTDENIQINNKQNADNLSRGGSTLGNICKTVKFISVTDYSIFKTFNNDIYAVEADMLANLNLAEGAFTTLNLGPGGGTDVGTDNLHFSMQEMVITTCENCEIIPLIESNVGRMNVIFDRWIHTTYAQSRDTIFQFWSTRNLFFASTRLAGNAFGKLECLESADPAVTILKYRPVDAPYLRLVAAHETGHLLGCIHDDQVKADVRSFIMYSSATSANTRFSRLGDFGGANYSSQLVMRDKLFELADCIQNCQVESCDEVKDIAISWFDSGDSAKVSWSGSGDFITRFKLKNDQGYDPANIKLIHQNSSVLYNLSPCTEYEFTVQKICNANSTGDAATLIFTPSSLRVSKIEPMNRHGDLYDLRLTVQCRNCSAVDYFIEVDHNVYSLPANSSGDQLLIKDLFADGAVHRIDMRRNQSDSICKFTSFYTAPYYRDNSTQLAVADFNDCNMPAGWKDSVLSNVPNANPNAAWTVAQLNSPTSLVTVGNFDGSCMIYCNNLNLANITKGALFLTSPPIDLAGFSNIYLHFDYSYLGFFLLDSSSSGSISIQAWNGDTWVTLFTKNSQKYISTTFLSQIYDVWDSLPRRAFISLDSFKRKDFQVRFIADDGSYAFARRSFLFAAFDNIVIDGYRETAGSNSNDFIVYPNPAKDEVLVRFKLPTPGNFTYTIHDNIGRVIRKGLLNNYRIDLKGMASGIYFITIYQQGQKLNKSKKIVKY